MAKLVKVTYEEKLQDVNVHSSEPVLWTSVPAVFSNQDDPNTSFSVLDPWENGWNDFRRKQEIIILYDTRDCPLILLMACLWPLKKCCPSEERTEVQMTSPGLKSGP